MLNLKKLLTKLCEKVTLKRVDVAQTGKRGNATFLKFGDMVFCYSSGDITSLPSQTYVVIATIPEGFRPTGYIYSRVQNEFAHNIIVTASADGKLQLYNSSSAITSATNGAFQMFWSTV